MYQRLLWVNTSHFMFSLIDMKSDMLYSLCFFFRGQHKSSKVESELESSTTKRCSRHSTGCESMSIPFNTNTLNRYTILCRIVLRWTTIIFHINIIVNTAYRLTANTTVILCLDSLWYDPTGARIYDLSPERRARQS